MQFGRRRGVGHGAGILPRLSGGSGYVSGMSGYPVASHAAAGAQSTTVTDGHVIIIGGAEDKVRDRVILSRFAGLAGGRDATVVVISTASSLGELAGDRYKQVLGELGVSKVRAIHATTRAQANDDTVALALRDATGIFMTGGNQLRLSSTIGGTRLADAVLEQFRKGAVVAGTSAGASAMSSHMIAFGASGATPKHRMAQIAAGLGVLPGVIVDQHFQQRNRLGRLLSLIAQNPSLLGLGVDEDTAGVVGPDHVMEVIGRGSITVVDGARSETDAWEVKGHRPLMISGVVLHSLPAGYRFDLQRRERIVSPTLHALPGGEAASS
jgi:cyanophycinase